MANEGLELAKQVTALAALFECDVSIDWIQELTGLKASQIILCVEQGIEQGLFSKKGPGIFCFKNNKKRQAFIDSIEPENLQRLHRLISNILLRDVADGKSAVRHISKHLLQIPNDVEDCRLLLKAGELYRKAYDPKQAMQLSLIALIEPPMIALMEPLKSVHFGLRRGLFFSTFLP